MKEKTIILFSLLLFAFAFGMAGCDDGNDYDPGVVGGKCDKDTACCDPELGLVLPNGTACGEGAGNVCHEGLCIAAQCECNDADAECCDGCFLTEGYCFIEGQCFSANENSPEAGCLYCDPLVYKNAWSAYANGTPCEDSDWCTQGETCSAGQCMGGAPRDCSAAATDSQCQVGVCNSETEACIAEPVNEGNPCNDGFFCTIEDACSAGVCAGNTRDCSAVLGDSQCQVAHCDEDANVCMVENKTNGANCDDGLFCTENDSCIDGYCAPGAGRDCRSEAANECQEGYCDEQYDECRVDMYSQNGMGCNDGNLCTGSPTYGEDVCVNGSCMPGGPSIDCQAQYTGYDTQCSVVQCNPETGKCEIDRQTMNGEACEDGLFCTENSVCGDGICQGGTPRDCSYMVVDEGCERAFCIENRDCDDCENGGAGYCDVEPYGIGNACEDDGFACTKDYCRVVTVLQEFEMNPPNGAAGTEYRRVTHAYCYHEVGEDQCLIDGTCYGEGEKNPDNQCFACDPSERDIVTDNTNGSGTDIICGDADIEGMVPCTDGEADAWSVRYDAGNPLAATCEDDDFSCTVDYCNADGVCMHDEVEDGECFIDGTCYEHGDRNPASDCQACMPCGNTATCQDDYQTDWFNLTYIEDDPSTTGVDEEMAYACADDGNACTIDMCVNGACVHDTDVQSVSMVPLEGGNPVEYDYGVTKTNCFIDGVCYDVADKNPANSCEACLPCNPSAGGCGIEDSNKKWTGLDATNSSQISSVSALDAVSDSEVYYACGEGSDCTTDMCVEGACEADYAVDEDACFIDGTCYVEGDKNPTNTCQVCWPCGSGQDDPGCIDNSLGGRKSWSDIDYATNIAYSSGTEPAGYDKNDADYKGAACVLDSLDCTVEACVAGACTADKDGDDLTDLVADTCLIDGACFNAYFNFSNAIDPANATPVERAAAYQAALNPGADCMYCDSDTNMYHWTAIASGQKCADDEFACTRDYCEAGGGTCMHDDIDDETIVFATAAYNVATADLGPKSWANGCLIGNVCYEADDKNPANECEICDGTKWDDGVAVGTWPSTDGPWEVNYDLNWWPLGAIDYNDPDVQLPAGTTLNDWEANACTDDGIECTRDMCINGACNHAIPDEGWCLMDGVCYEDSHRNPANRCQECVGAPGDAYDFTAQPADPDDGYYNIDDFAKHTTWQDVNGEIDPDTGWPVDMDATEFANNVTAAPTKWQDGWQGGGLCVPEDEDGLGCTWDICLGGACVPVLMSEYDSDLDVDTTKGNACLIDGVCYDDGGYDDSGSSNPNPALAHCQVCRNWYDYNTDDEFAPNLMGAGAKQYFDVRTNATYPDAYSPFKQWQVAEGTCMIDDVCYHNGQNNPANMCQKCDNDNTEAGDWAQNAASTDPDTFNAETMWKTDWAVPAGGFAACNTEQISGYDWDADAAENVDNANYAPNLCEEFWCVPDVLTDWENDSNDDQVAVSCVAFAKNGDINDGSTWDDIPNGLNAVLTDTNKVDASCSDDIDAFDEWGCQTYTCDVNGACIEDDKELGTYCGDPNRGCTIFQTCDAAGACQGGVDRSTVYMADLTKVAVDDASPNRDCMVEVQDPLYPFDDYGAMPINILLAGELCHPGQDLAGTPWNYQGCKDWDPCSTDVCVEDADDPFHQGHASEQDFECQHVDADCTDPADDACHWTECAGEMTFAAWCDDVLYDPSTFGPGSGDDDCAINYTVDETCNDTTPYDALECYVDEHNIGACHVVDCDVDTGEIFVTEVVCPEDGLACTLDMCDFDLGCVHYDISDVECAPAYADDDCLTAACVEDSGQASGYRCEEGWVYDPDNNGSDRCACDPGATDCDQLANACTTVSCEDLYDVDSDRIGTECVVTFSDDAYEENDYNTVQFATNADILSPAISAANPVDGYAEIWDGTADPDLYYKKICDAGELTIDLEIDPDASFTVQLWDSTGSVTDITGDIFGGVLSETYTINVGGNYADRFLYLMIENNYSGALDGTCEPYTLNVFSFDDTDCTEETVLYPPSCFDDSVDDESQVVGCYDSYASSHEWTDGGGGTCDNPDDYKPEGVAADLAMLGWHFDDNMNLKHGLDLRNKSVGGFWDDATDAWTVQERDDFYGLPICFSGGGTYQINSYFLHSEGDINMKVYEEKDDCSELISTAAWVANTTTNDEGLTIAIDDNGGDNGPNDRLLLNVYHNDIDVDDTVYPFTYTALGAADPDEGHLNIYDLRIIYDPFAGGDNGGEDDSEPNSSFAQVLNAQNTNSAAPELVDGVMRFNRLVWAGNEEDWFYFDTCNGAEFELDLGLSYTGGAKAVDVMLYDMNGNQLNKTGGGLAQDLGNVANTTVDFTGANAPDLSDYPGRQGPVFVRIKYNSDDLCQMLRYNIRLNNLDIAGCAETGCGDGTVLCCSDGVDNDDDGLTDLADPDCDDSLEDDDGDYVAAPIAAPAGVGNEPDLSALGFASDFTGDAPYTTALDVAAVKNGGAMLVLFDQDHAKLAVAAGDAFTITTTFTAGNVDLALYYMEEVETNDGNYVWVKGYLGDYDATNNPEGVVRVEGTGTETLTWTVPGNSTNTYIYLEILNSDTGVTGLEYNYTVEVAP